MTTIVTEEPAERTSADRVATGGAPTAPDGHAALRRHGVAALVVFLLCVGLLAWSWVRFDRAQHDPRRIDAATRDAVVAATTRDVATLNTFDSAHVGQALATWQAVTTGDLHDQMSRVSAKERTALAATRSVSTGRVAEVAVTGLDSHAGTADAMTFVTVTVQPAQGRAHVLRHRYRVELREVSGTWLVSSIVPIEVAQR
ncbi:hypothetical protein [Nocardioides ultimimeridianus]